MEPFKNLLNAALIDAAGAQLQAMWPAFDRTAFGRIASSGLDRLEMKARAMQIADALEATLPADFDAACDIIERSLATALEPGVAPAAHDPGLRGWVVWPLGEFVARRGMAEPARALEALHALTQRLTAEFAIRPFIVAHPARVFATFERWKNDPSAHVRRLVSEGSRPRLPWGMRLHALVKDPAPSLPLLAALQDDASDYVRRSVANHLNDIAKDHPSLVAGWVQEYLPNASEPRRSVLRHASRSLIKQGHAQMLALWGAGEPFEGSARLVLSSKKVRVGESVTFRLTLRSRADRTQQLLVDYAVHHLRANGEASAKVFKGWRLPLAPRAVRELQKTHSMRVITTRRYHAGRHVIDARINGQTVASAAFMLKVDEP